MKISQLIERLQEIKEKHGDLPIFYTDHEVGGVREVIVAYLVEAQECAFRGKEIIKEGKIVVLDID